MQRQLPGQRAGRSRGLRSGLARPGSVLVSIAWLAVAPTAAGLPFTAPDSGSFSEAAEIEVAGAIATSDPSATTAVLDDQPLLLLAGAPLPGGEVEALFSVLVALDGAAVFQSFLLEWTLPDGRSLRDRRSVVVGPFAPDGEASPRASALHVTSRGLEAFAPAIEGLVAFDLAAVLPVDRRIYNKCLVDTFAGCIGRARVYIDDPPPRFDGQEVELSLSADGVGLDLTLRAVRIDLDIRGSGVVPDCRLRLTADAVHIRAVHGIAPDASEPTRLDLVQSGALDVDFDRFRQNFTGGSCNDGLIEDVVDDIVGDLEGEVRDALEELLEDPDGVGSQDGPLAEAIEDALAGVEIAAPIGEALEVDLAAPLSGVVVDATGLSLVTDTAVDARIDPLLGCDAPADGIDPPGSYEPPGFAPVPGERSSQGALPYDVALSLSDAAFAQGLEAFTVCGLLHSDLEELRLGDSVFPIDAALLALIEPAFAALPGGLPLTIEVRPRLAPILGDGAGPQGELAPLRIADLRLRVVDPADGFAWIEMAVDATAGLHFGFDPVSGELELSTAGALADVRIVVLGNAVGADEASLVATLAALLENGTISLSDDLGRFRLPSFLGLSLLPVEIAREAGGAIFFFEAVPVPEPGARMLGVVALAVAIALRALAASVGAADPRRPASGGRHGARDRARSLRGR